MRIGIITAMADETVPILAKRGGVVAEDEVSGVKIRQIETGKHTVYLATSGIGEIRAALAVQLLVDLFDIEAVLNFGFVGSLNKSLPVGELVIVERAVHYQFDISAVDNLPPGCYDDKDEPYFYTDKEELFTFPLRKTYGSAVQTVRFARRKHTVRQRKT